MARNAAGVQRVVDTMLDSRIDFIPVDHNLFRDHRALHRIAGSNPFLLLDPIAHIRSRPVQTTMARVFLAIYPHGTSNKAGSKPISRRSDSSARLRLSFQSLHRGPDLLGRLSADVEDADEFQKRYPTQVPQALIPGAEEGTKNYWPE